MGTVGQQIRIAAAAVMVAAATALGAPTTVAGATPSDDVCKAGWGMRCGSTEQQTNVAPARSFTSESATGKIVIPRRVGAVYDLPVAALRTPALGGGDAVGGWFRGAERLLRIAGFGCACSSYKGCGPTKAL